VHPNVVAIYQSLARRYGSLVDAKEGESSKKTKNADEVVHMQRRQLSNTRV
jgi:hypothetical protein